VRGARRKFPDEESIDGPEGELALLGAGARAVGVIEDARHLGAAEVRIEHEARALAEERQVACVTCSARSDRSVRRSCQTMARCMGWPLCAVPHHGGLALVRDADAAAVVALHLGAGQRLRGGFGDAPPDLGEVVLHPTRLGVVLREFTVGAPEDARVLRQYDHRRPGRALVDG
jgi:hypothetical protein